jgi:hypothetical protein
MDGPQRKDMPNWLIPLLQWGLPFIVTVGGLLIAWRQVEINRRQIRFQFHEKRLAVYEASRTLIALAMRNGTVTQEEWKKFARDTKGVAFLFDKKIDDYCREIYNHAVDVGVSHYVIETAPSSPNYKPCVDKWSDGMKWFTEQDKVAEKLFKPYLQVRD